MTAHTPGPGPSGLRELADALDRGEDYKAHGGLRAYALQWEATEQALEGLINISLHPRATKSQIVMIATEARDLLAKAKE